MHVHIGIGLFAAAQLMFAIIAISWSEHDHKFTRATKGFLMPGWFFCNVLAIMCLVGEASTC